MNFYEVLQEKKGKDKNKPEYPAGTYSIYAKTVASPKYIN